MRVLIVSATAAEIQPFVSTLQRRSDVGARTIAYSHRDRDIAVLITGVGMVATAAWCSAAMTRERFDLALNFGLCGSFDPSLAPGRVVHVVSDRLPEIGAEDGDAFLALEDLQLPGEQDFVNAQPPAIEALRVLPVVRGITVNTVHGNDRSIAAVMARWAPQVESMEGAAFMFACQMHGVPFAQVRAVSNAVERRNRQAWKMKEAMASLNEAAAAIVEGS